MTAKKRCPATALAAALVLLMCAGCTKQAKRNRYLARADRDFAAGQYDKAEIDYLNVLRVVPYDPAAISRLGIIYYAEGKPQRAFTFLKKAAEVDPENVEVRLRLGQSQLGMHNLKEAREEAVRVLQKQPRNEEAYLLLAKSLTNLSEIPQMLQLVEGFRPKDQDCAGYHLAVGILKLGQNDTNAGEAEFKKAVAVDARSSAAYQAIGALYLSRNDLKQAEPALKSAMELAPMRSAIRLAFANFKLQTGGVDEGKKALEEMTKKAPDYVPAWVRRAEVAFADTNFTDCATFLNQALSRDSTTYQALLLNGRLQLANTNKARALAEFEKMGKIYQRSPEVPYYTAYAQLLAPADTAKALASVNQALVLAKALALDPRADPFTAQATLLQARITLIQRDTGLAIATLKDLLKVQPQYLAAGRDLAAAYCTAGRWDEALDVYGQLEKLDPRNPDPFFLTGLIYEQQGKKLEAENKPGEAGKKRNEARAVLVKTLELKPDYLPAVEHLVDLDLSDKEYAAATARVQKEIEKSPKEGQPHLLAAKIHIYQAGDRVRQENLKQGGKDLPVAEARTLLARLPEAQREMGLAEGELLKATELKPELEEAYLLLARAYADTGKSGKALEELNAVLSQKPGDTPALLQVAMIQNEVKNYPAARAAYEKLIAANYKSYYVLNNLAYLYSQKFQLYDQAFDMARQARELLTYKTQPGENNAAEDRARLAIEQTRAAATDTLGWIIYRRGHGEYPWALALLQESADRLPLEPEIQYHLGMACYMLGLEDRARSALKSALKLGADFDGKEEIARRLANLDVDAKTADPKVLAGLEGQLREQPDDPVVLSRLAVIYERDKTPEKTLKAYEAAFKENSKNVPVLAKLALLYAAPGRFHDLTKALERANAAGKLDPDNSQITLLLGRLMFEDGKDYPRALTLLKQAAAKLAVQDPEAQYDLALAYYSVGRVPEAEAAMRGASAGAAFSRAAEARQFLELAPLSFNPIGAAQAEPRAREILKSKPDDVPALMVVAGRSEQQGNAQAARQIYEQVLGKYPDFAPAEKHLAALFVDLGEAQKAYKMAAKAREALPDDPEVTYCIGAAHFQLFKETKDKKDQLREKNDSQRELREALKLNPQAKFAAKANQMLAELTSGLPAETRN